MLSVLIIEDEVIIGMLLTKIITDMGHSVIGVEGTERGAVDAAASTRPGLMLVDQRLRTGSGQGAVEQILRDGFIPHIWMTGAAVLNRNLGRGVAMLEKPFSERDLQLAIEQVLEPAAPITPAGGAAKPGHEDEPA